MGLLARRPWGVGRAGLRMYVARLVPFLRVRAKWGSGTHACGAVPMSRGDGIGAVICRWVGGRRASGWGWLRVRG
eukprot:6154654-Alexandrium_andersonii.AAC.1